VVPFYWLSQHYYKAKQKLSLDSSLALTFSRQIATLFGVKH